MFIQVENGMARHQHTITPTEGTRLMKAFYVSIIVYNVSLCSAKVSRLSIKCTGHRTDQP